MPEDVDFRVVSGEIVTSVGPKGSGMPTLLHALVGAVKPVSGRAVRASDLCIGYVPQTLSPDPTLPMPVARFLSLPRRVSASDRHEVLDGAGVSDLGDRQMTDLSGGRLQRALLARAPLSRPDLLLLDEATARRDQLGGRGLLPLDRGVVRRETGCGIVMVSHDPYVVMIASDRLMICLNGHICCEGAPEVVAEAPVHRALFGEGTQGAFALYRHHQDHGHAHGPGHAPHPGTEATE